MCDITENQRKAIAHLEIIREQALAHLASPTPGEHASALTFTKFGVDPASIPGGDLISAVVKAERAERDAQAEQVRVTHEVLIALIHSGRYDQWNEDTGTLDTRLEDIIAAVADAQEALKAAEAAYEAYFQQREAELRASFEARTATVQ